MPLFDVEVTVRACSYIQIEAEDEAAARKIAGELTPEIDWNYPPQTVDTSCFDNFADVEIGCSGLSDDDESQTSKPGVAKPAQPATTPEPLNPGDPK